MNDYTEIACILFKKKQCSVLTGAGISVDSGIPDFRSAGGIWDRFDPKIYSHIDSFKKDPIKIWKFFKAISEEFGNAKPNPAHYAIAELEKLGIIKSIATQNVDNLHTKAGSKNVFYLHGNNESLVCIKCDAKYAYDKPYSVTESIPYCKCGKVLKPDVIMFGEQLPLDILKKAENDAKQSKVYIVAGTSAVVMPAALLPHRAKENGAIIIEINLEETALSSSITDFFLKGSTTDILPKILYEINKIINA